MNEPGEPEEPTELTAGTAGGSVGYAAAVAELDRILAELEDPAIDVDGLAERVRRAAELIELCRERITRARMDVEQVVAGLDDLG